MCLLSLLHKIRYTVRLSSFVTVHLSLQIFRCLHLMISLVAEIVSGLGVNFFGTGCFLGPQIQTPITITLEATATGVSNLAHCCDFLLSQEWRHANFQFQSEIRFLLTVPFFGTEVRLALNQIFIVFVDFV